MSSRLAADTGQSSNRKSIRAHVTLIRVRTSSPLIRLYHNVKLQSTYQLSETRFNLYLTSKIPLMLNFPHSFALSSLIRSSHFVSVNTSPYRTFEKFAQSLLLADYYCTSKFILVQNSSLSRVRLSTQSSRFLIGHQLNLAYAEITVFPRLWADMSSKSSAQIDGLSVFCFQTRIPLKTPRIYGKAGLPKCLYFQVAWFHERES